MSRVKKEHNLVFVVADKHGCIKWNRLALNPYTFAATFLQSTGTVSYLNDKKEANRLGFVVNKELCDKVLDDLSEEQCDSLRQIKLRRQGLVLGDLLPGLMCYSRLGYRMQGYLFELPDWQRSILERAGIRHYKVGKPEEE